MGFPVIPTTGLFARLAAILADQYPTTTGSQAKLRLYTNDVTPDANMVVDTFVELELDGYTAKLLTMSAPTMNDQGLVCSRCAAEFDIVAGETPTQVYGVYITNFGNTEVLAAQRFDTPQLVGGDYATAVAGVWRMSEPLTSMGWIDVEN